jgi:NhaA family Na+:H+ antiporter
VYRHYPLEGIHPGAFLAAVAAECAGAQGQFKEFHDVLFAKQAQLTGAHWTDLAREAHVRDPRLLAQCVRAGTYSSRVVQDIIAGDSLGVIATPTLLVNDVRFSGAPRLAFLDSLVQAALASTK